MYFYTLVRSELAVFSLYAKLIASSQGYFFLHDISLFGRIKNISCVPEFFN